MADDPYRDERVQQRAAAEQAIRARHAAGDIDGATTMTLDTYGAELFGFLYALARDDDTAGEAFSMFAEDLWKGLPGFRWESSLRTWVYALARNALHRVRRDPARRPGRNLPLSAAPSEVVAAVRTATQPFLRTDVKDRFAELRDLLDPDDHALLILRVDRRMSWRDIARAMPSDDAAEDVERRAATLRKRFERAKALLRTLAAERGLLPRDR
jgi:RNA polymerase sigma-70 factor, ECF subfamily